MNWTNSSILSFVRLYKGHPCIWNPQHSLNKNRHSVNEAWADIQNSMPIPCTIPELKKKKESLMTIYRRFKTRIRTSLNENGETTYKPTWFAFKAMDSFLSAIYSPESEGEEGSSLAVEEIDEKQNLIATQENDETEYEDEVETECDDAEAPPPKRMKKGRYDSLTIDQRELDEIEVMTRIWGRKLRKIPQERRDSLIYKINNLIFSDDVQQNLNAAGFSDDCSMEMVFIDEGR